MAHMVEINESEIVQECKAIYQNFLESYQSNDYQIVISRFGSFSQDLINRLSDITEELMMSYGEKKTLVKRVFTILIEGLQNIKIHGEVDLYDQQIGFLLIAKNDTGYQMRFASLCESSSKNQLSHQIENLNSLSDEKIKSLYVDTLSNGIISQKGGAGLGFITMRLRSKEKLKYHFYPLNDEKYLFTVEVQIRRES